MIKRITLATVLLLLVHANAWAQTVSGVRGISGGVGALHSLTGPTGGFYIDGQGTQGSLYSAGTFESFNFRTPNGPAWMGSMMTLGPRLSVGLVAGANQAFFSGATGTNVLVGSPIVIPPPPRELPPLPEIQSSLLDEIP
ncbi:MAG: hypothetical protein ACREIS_08340 [Nitrospiraceae bacterium]